MLYICNILQAKLIQFLVFNKKQSVNTCYIVMGIVLTNKDLLELFMKSDTSINDEETIIYINEYNKDFSVVGKLDDSNCKYELEIFIGEDKIDLTIGQQNYFFGLMEKELKDNITPEYAKGLSQDDYIYFESLIIKS